jgi:hypothetical protein
MWYMMKLLLQIAALLGGLLAFYLSAFMYEKGQARMRNKLEDWWIGLRRNEQFAGFPGAAFLQSLSGSINIRSIRLFMEEPFSPDWIIVTANFSLLSCLWIPLALTIVRLGWTNPLALLAIATDKDSKWIIPTAVFLVWPGTFVVLLIWKIFVDHAVRMAAALRTLPSSLSNLFSRNGLAALSVSVQNVLPSSYKFELKSVVAGFKALLRFCTVSFIYLFTFFFALMAVPLVLLWFAGLAFFTLSVVAPGTLALSWYWIILVPSAGIASAMLFLALMQYILGRCWIRPFPFRKALLALLSMLLLASFLFLGPLWFAGDGWTLHTPMPEALNTPSSIARYLAYCNGLDVIVAYGFFAAGLLLLVHTLVWSRLRRAIIAMRLAGVGFNRAVLCALGIGLVLMGSGQIRNLFNAFMSHPQIYEDIKNFFKSLIP